jgi:REP element-mobilizing transposase RayT
MLELQRNWATMRFHFFNPNEPVDVTQRHLPHWEQRDAYYFITYRTADSIPANVLEQWQRDRNAWLLCHGIDPTQEDWQRDVEQLPEAVHREFYSTFTTKWHEHLDDCHGDCVLRQPALSAIVAENLHHFDGECYELDSFVVMPNHVHVLAGIAGRSEMRKHCRNWKKYSATRINEQLGRTGQFWQWESYDHLVRSERSLAKFRDYIAQNPVKAKLRPGEYALYLRPVA